MKPLNQLTPEDLKEIMAGFDRAMWIKVGVGALVLLLFVLFVFMPAWFGRGGIKLQLQDIKSQLETVETLSIRKPELLRTKENLEQFINDAKARLFDKDETALLLGAISKLAQESGVGIISSSPQESKVQFPKPFNSKYELSLFKFAVEGGYHQLGELVARVENNEKLLRIQDFHMRPSKDDPTKHLATFTVSAVSRIKKK